MPNRDDARPEMLLGGCSVAASPGDLRSFAAATGSPIEPGFREDGEADVADAADHAARAFDAFRETTPDTRAGFLEAIADAILDLGEALIERVMLESGLPRARLEGERGRTVGQLRLFAGVLREGSWLGVRVDPAQPERAPAPRPDLRLRRVPLGPVAVFGASNFPLAFSVAGGDTASALAAGCPVIVKAHPAHLGTSALVATAIERARVATGMPEGVFALLTGANHNLSRALVADPRIKAVGFTGSRVAGLTLAGVAANRPEPIPVYAEMSSINPVILFPHALADRAPDIATAFVQSLTLGAGQFCTNPGLVLAIDGPALDTFVAAAVAALQAVQPATMLTPAIHAAYSDAVAARAKVASPIAQGKPPQGPHEAHPQLFQTDAQSFIATHHMQDEIFGPAALIVCCADAGEVRAVLTALEGQLTIAVHIAEADHAAVAELLPLIEQKAGRILANGFGTGVEVAHAMVHGGPFPATSDPRSTSVGSLAIKRFLRPVCYQDLPDALLPAALRQANPLALPRRIDGVIERGGD